MKYNVIVPVYNTKIEYIKKCLDSFLNIKRKDYRVTLINDGSTDQKVIDYINSINSKHVTVIHNKKNIGLGATRNVGIEFAIQNNDQYILFFDSDDWTTSDIFSKLDNCIKNDNYDFISFNAYDVYLKNGKHIYKENDDYVHYVDNDIVIWRGVTSTSKCYSVDFLDKNNIRFFEKKYYHEDNYFMLMLLRYVDKIGSIPDHLYCRSRFNEESITNTISNEISYTHLILCLSSFRLSKKDPKRLKDYYYQHYFQYAFKYFVWKNINKKVFLKYFRRLRKNDKVFYKRSFISQLKYFVKYSWLYALYFAWKSTRKKSKIEGGN